MSPVSGRRMPSAVSSPDVVSSQRTLSPGVVSTLRALGCVLVVAAALLLVPLALAAPSPRVPATPVGEGVQELAAWPTRGHAASALLPAEEQADSLSTDFAVDTDGSVVVTETIRWRFPDGEERHGILRNVKVRAGYQDSKTQYRYYELTGVSVTSPSGAPTDIAISDFGAYRQIRIGSPSQTISGTADYVVRYRLAHIVNDIGDGTAEFYYNVVDPSNGFPQLNVSATVRARSPPRGPRASPASSARPPRARRWRVRPRGSPCPTSRRRRAQACSRSTWRTAFGDLTPDLREGDPESDSTAVVSHGTARLLGWLAIGLGVLLPLLALGLAWACSCGAGGGTSSMPGSPPGLTPGVGQEVPVVVGGPEPTVAVQFTPPAGVQPGMLGTILDEEVNLVDVTATLVDLAVRGHLQIARDDQGVFRADDWILTRTAPPAGAALVPYEQVLLTRCSLRATGSRCRS